MREVFAGVQIVPFAIRGLSDENSDARTFAQQITNLLVQPDIGLLRSTWAAIETQALTNGF
jgi:hypothetical protein